jgi:hypothetical protein
MLEILKAHDASDRKLRLFAVACCRRIWDLLADEAREAAVVAEAFADGLLDDAKRSDARKLAQRAAQGRGVIRTPAAPKWERRAASTAYYATARQAMEAAWNAPQLGVEVLVWKQGGYGACDAAAIRQVEEVAQAVLLRDIFANPFRPVIFDHFSLTAAVIALAQTIYDERDFERMPELAVELEAAGCTNNDILGHCRSQGPHVRGCWVLDLILLKC